MIFWRSTDPFHIYMNIDFTPLDRNAFRSGKRAIKLKMETYNKRYIISSEVKTTSAVLYSIH